MLSKQVLNPRCIGVVTDRVWLEKEDPSVLRVSGIIVDSSLQLLGYETDLPIKCISFDKTYFGTDVVRSAVLYNHSPESMRFVMVLNDTAQGQMKVLLCHLQFVYWGVRLLLYRLGYWSVV